MTGDVSGWGQRGVYGVEDVQGPLRVTEGDSEEEGTSEKV